MKRLLSNALVALLLMAIWTAAMVAGTMNGWWHRPIAPSPSNEAYLQAVTQQIASEFVGNFALAIVENGQVVEEVFHSAGRPVDRHTVFQVASLSKWVSAFGIMKLVEQGTLDLDAPVEKYLTRWHLPPSEFDNEGVTVRRLLSHTAGLTDGLGYSGFDAMTPIQTLEASLTKAADADSGTSGSVRVGLEPGSAFEYSGGGYTLLQLLVEEVTGSSFASFMKDSIFVPLGMEQSSFTWDDSSGLRLAELFEADGQAAPHYRYTALAAASLYISLQDMERFVQVFLQGPDGEAVGRGVLRPETIRMMRTPQAKTMGLDAWGLGTILYAPISNQDFIIGHDGRNRPTTNTAVRLNPATGDGIIVLETGSQLLATKLASEWVFWKTGKVDLLLLSMGADGMKRGIIIGWLVILTGLVVFWVARARLGRQRSAPAQ